MAENTEKMELTELTEIIEIQKQPYSIFDPVMVESILRKGYKSSMNDMNLMIQVFDKLTEIRRRYLIWYGVEWSEALKNTPTLTTDEYVLGLLVSIETDWITTYDFPSNDIAERMKNEDASKLKSVLTQGK
jgi:hypothetical protein